MQKGMQMHVAGTAPSKDMMEVQKLIARTSKTRSMSAESAERQPHLHLYYITTVSQAYLCFSPLLQGVYCNNLWQMLHIFTMQEYIYQQIHT